MFRSHSEREREAKIFLRASEKFKEIAEAYASLSDLFAEAGGAESFFGGGGFGGGCDCSSRGRRQRRGEDLIRPLKVSLEDLYLGSSKKLSLSRNVICSNCSGEGSQFGGWKKCAGCKGDKVVPEKKLLEVMVDKGMQDNQRITFPGEAEEAPDTVTGDVVFVIQQEEHPRFKRIGDDLFVEHTLSRLQADWGYEFFITHLDGRRLRIKSCPGEIVQHDSSRVVPDEGMPVYRKPLLKGKLFIHFTIDNPDRLTAKQVKAPVERSKGAARAAVDFNSIVRNAIFHHNAIFYGACGIVVGVWLKILL